MISYSTAVARYRRVGAMMDADTTRFAPNPRGSGYLTRQERYCEIRRALEAVISRHELSILKSATARKIAEEAASRPQS